MYGFFLKIILKCYIPNEFGKKNCLNFTSNTFFLQIFVISAKIR